MFKLKDINEINKRIVSYLFQLIARLKSSADQEQHFFFVIFTTNSKQNIDLNVASHFNFEIQVKVSFLLFLPILFKSVKFII
jgi:hypothetical protein